jgi:hypothetical protein
MEIIHKIGLFIIFIFAFSLSIAVTYSQTNELPCSAPEAAQFDFWVGKWQAKWVDSENKEQYGENIITKGMNNCVIEENFSTDDKTFIGRSLSMYNVNKKIWEQTWVDNNGSYMNFTGGKDGSNMFMQRNITTKAGKEIIQRMVFTDITKDTFTWNWESSSDNGATWSLAWKINYTRKQ